MGKCRTDGTCSSIHAPRLDIQRYSGILSSITTKFLILNIIMKLKNKIITCLIYSISAYFVCLLCFLLSHSSAGRTN